MLPVNQKTFVLLHHFVSVRDSKSLWLVHIEIVTSFYVFNPCLNQFSLSNYSCTHLCQAFKGPSIFFFLYRLPEHMYSWGRRQVCISIFKLGRCTVIFISDASVSAPPIFNLIQSTSDSREWGERKYPHTTQILFLSSSSVSEKCDGGRAVGSGFCLRVDMCCGRIFLRCWLGGKPQTHVDQHYDKASNVQHQI